MNVRYTLKQLGDLAVGEVGFCVGIHWRSVTGSCVPPGMISPNCRLTYVLFSGFAPAYRFHDLLTRIQVDRLPRHTIRLVRVAHAGQTMVGVAVIAVVSPDRDHAAGLRRAPAHHRQLATSASSRRGRPGRTRCRPGGTASSATCPTLTVSRHTGSSRWQTTPSGRPTRNLERELDRLEAAYDEKLWWHGAPGRRTKYPPALGSVRELFAYARKQEITPDEFARRNRERQTEQWLNEQHEGDRQRQQELDADQAEIAAVLQTSRRGRAHADDQDWLATEQALRARKGLKHLYRDAAPRPSRPAEV